MYNYNQFFVKLKLISIQACIFNTKIYINLKLYVKINFLNNDDNQDNLGCWLKYYFALNNAFFDLIAFIYCFKFDYEFIPIKKYFFYN